MEEAIVKDEGPPLNRSLDHILLPAESGNQILILLVEYFHVESQGRPKPPCRRRGQGSGAEPAEETRPRLWRRPEEGQSSDDESSDDEPAEETRPRLWKDAPRLWSSPKSSKSHGEKPSSRSAVDFKNTDQDLGSPHSTRL